MIRTSFIAPSQRIGLRLCAGLLLLVVAACGGRGDSNLENETRTRLQADPATQNLNLTVTADGGVVRLTGETTSGEAKSRAVELARSVEGVTNVVDEIQLTESPLAAAVRAALKSDPMVGAIPIEVEAEDTLIRLRSDQTNQEQRTRAVQVARQVQGVEAVEDNMK